MTFFARPNLSDEQFKQLQGTTLTLSGQTRIGTVTGLTLANNSIGTSYPNITITAEGADAHVGDVLTYDGLGKICLRPAAGGSGDPIYPSTCKSPSVVALCGLPVGYTLTGKTLSHILEKILVPTLNPAVQAPSNTLTILPITTIFEVGSTPSITATINFNRGSISPQYYGASSCRSGAPSTYNYTVFGYACAPILPSPAGNNTNSLSLTLPTSIYAGSGNIISGCVSFYSGLTPAYNSSGGIYAATLGAGTTPAQSIVLTGIYPYFWGKVASGGAPAGSNRPTPNAALINSGNKVVGDSMGTLNISFNSTFDDYIWFATPVESPTKTCWYVTALNNWFIGGAVSPGGNLFPDYAPVSPTSVIWSTVGSSPHAYKLYVSNYQYGTTEIMQLRNS